MVGWVTPQASAARPKCRSFASASSSSSLSIKRIVPGVFGAKEIAGRSEIARTGGHQHVKSAGRTRRFSGTIRFSYRLISQSYLPASFTSHRLSKRTPVRPLQPCSDGPNVSALGPTAEMQPSAFQATAGIAGYPCRFQMSVAGNASRQLTHHRRTCSHLPGRRDPGNIRSTRMTCYPAVPMNITPAPYS